MSLILRSRLSLLFILAAMPGSFGYAQVDSSDAFGDAIGNLERETGGIVGVYAIDTGSGRELEYRSNERFAMASTFKPLLVASVLNLVDAGRLGLDDPVDIDRERIVSYSPFIEAVADGQSVTLAELAGAVLTLGDNTATNLLLESIGGPDALTAFLRRHGDSATRLDRYETELNANTRGDPRDTTTPKAMIGSLLGFLNTDVLSDESKTLLQDWMVASMTGATRLRAGLPSDWRVGDKTGTGMNGAVNNIAVAWPPDRQPIAIAVYMSWSEADIATLGAHHAVVASLVAEEFR
jgi:beta-lactamase class A